MYQVETQFTRSGTTLTGLDNSVRMMSASTHYRLSFTSGGLFVDECIALANMFAGLGDWDLVKTEAVKADLLAFRTSASSKRTVRELVDRLRCLSNRELEELREGTRDGAASILWVAVCRLYRLLFEFCAEVLRDNARAFRLDVDHADFDSFFNQKAEWHPELDALSESTRKKLRQNAFRMMREANLLTADNRMMSGTVTPTVIGLFQETAPESLLAFPTLETGPHG